MNFLANVLKRSENASSVKEKRNSVQITRRPSSCVCLYRSRLVNDPCDPVCPQGVSLLAWRYLVIPLHIPADLREKGTRRGTSRVKAIAPRTFLYRGARRRALFNTHTTRGRKQSAPNRARERRETETLAIIRSSLWMR